MSVCVCVFGCSESYQFGISQKRFGVSGYLHKAGK